MSMRMLISALFAVIMVGSGLALAQDSRTAVKVDLAGQTCQVCQDNGTGGCSVVPAVAESGIVVDKTTGANNAPQIIKLTCQVSGLINNSGKGLVFDVFNTGIGVCVVGDGAGYTIVTDNWRQTLSPSGVAQLSCLCKDCIF